MIKRCMMDGSDVEKKIGICLADGNGGVVVKDTCRFDERIELSETSIMRQSSGSVSILSSTIIAVMVTGILSLIDAGSYIVVIENCKFDAFALLSSGVMYCGALPNLSVLNCSFNSIAIENGNGLCVYVTCGLNEDGQF